MFAQGARVPATPQDKLSVPDVRRLVESSIAATRRSWQARLHYGYVERSEDRRRDSTGRVRSEDVEISRTVLVDNVPFEELIERNGHPPSAQELRKQKDEFDKLKRETPVHRAERLRILEEENTSLVVEVPKAFDFRMVGDDVVHGRPAFVLEATPRPGYHAQGKYGKMFSKVAGKLWIDKEDLGWIKVDGRVLQPFSMGLFLVRVLAGSQITMEQRRVDDGIWMPERVGVRAAAKIFFLRDLVVERVLTYSEYTLAQGAVPATRRSGFREVRQPYRDQATGGTLTEVESRSRSTIWAAIRLDP
jgi:hypothetical protein